MLFNSNTKNHIAKAMEHGVKLVVVYWPYDPEYGQPMQSAYLEHRGKRLTLTHKETNLRFSNRENNEQPREKLTVHQILDLTEDARLKQGYVYNGNAGVYRMMYEHINTPVPRWIREQWATPATIEDTSGDYLF